MFACTYERLGLGVQGVRAEREQTETLSQLLKPLALLICSPFLRLRTSLSTFHHTIYHFFFY